MKTNADPYLPVGPTFTHALIPGITISVETIDPERAAAFLSINKNRPPLNTRVQLYADAMRRSEWAFEGTPFVIDRDGNFIQGQHRALAVIRSQTPIHAVVVVRGVNPTAFDLIDTGKPRTVGDALGHIEVENYNVVANACRLIMSYGTGTRSLNTQFTGPQIKAFYKDNPELTQSIAPARKTKPLMGHGLGTALHFLFARKDKDAADVFFESLATGEQLSRTDPILVLRNRLLQKGPAKLPAAFVFAITIKAWNATRKGQAITLLKWLDESPIPEIE